MATKSSSALGARIRKTRLDSGLSQQQFARRLGIRQQKVSEWEQGKRLRAVGDALALLKVLGRRA